MDETTLDDASTPDDATLVARALDGDGAAFAQIYDRYADRVHTMATHLLANRDDAADVCGDVFLVAAERLAQLRDPSRLKPWLFAIARRQVYLRTHRRSRDVLVGEVDDMTTATSADHVESGVESAELAGVLSDAAAGLDGPDRLVLELSLQGLDGADLADAMGVSATNAYQASHRMKERLERSVGALLVARQGRSDCHDLDALLRDWDGRFSVLWRKRVARHVDGCEECTERRKKVPAVLFQGIAGAAPLVAAPVAVRDRVLKEARVGGDTGRPWRGDGFPPPDGIGRRRALMASAVILVLLVVGGLTLLVGTQDTEDVVASATAESEDRPTTTASTAPTTSVVAAPVEAPPSTAAPTTTAPAPTTGPPATAPPAAPPVTVTPPTPTTTAPQRSAPTIGSFTATASGVGSPCAGATQFRTILTWSTTDATSVAVTASDVSSTGLPPDGTTVACRSTPSAPPGGWTLTATGPGGSATDNVP